MTYAEQQADNDDFGKRYQPFDSLADGSGGIKMQHAADHIAYYLAEIARHLETVANAVSGNDHRERAKNLDVEKLAKACFGLE